jgi:TolB-like protein/Tfp pilus assembly protein PilF
MADEQKAKPRLEIGHVLFMDIVGYSKLLTDEQSETLHELNQIVRSTETARGAEAAGGLTILPTGDGMALVFTGSVEEPVECALEISQALRAEPSLPVRMGIHSGPIHHVTDANGRENIAGVGINIAQRVMDCGDAGHILVSKRVADDLAQQRRWQPYIHELGDVEMKHGVVVSLVNLYAETIGNPTPPSRLGKVHGGVRALSRGERKGLSPFARAIFIIVGLLIALIFVLAIVSVIFAPAIMRTLDQRRLAALPQPTATAPQSFADTIKNAITKQITDELKTDFSDKKKPGAEPPSGLLPAIAGFLPGSEKSIAVLPFENLSDDKSNAYFAEGIQDEILTRLSKIADLKVISRTSTQRFKSSPDNLPQIAKQLGVANILEGSVQKANDQVRVNVQLINALTDAHLWAETFDRKSTDLFGVESEIAKTIADTLRAKLTGSEETAISKKPTENQEAYELYLKGRHFWNMRTSEDLPKSVDYYNQAIAKDPNYALAFAGLADAYVLYPDYGVGSPAEYYPKAKEMATKALSLEPTLGPPHAALGLAYSNWDRDFKKAITEFDLAIQRDPNYATAYQWKNSALTALGEFDRAIASSKKAIALDPLSRIVNADLAFNYIYAHRFDDAVAQSRKTLEIDPNFHVVRGYLGLGLQLQGKLAEALPEYRAAAASTDEPFSGGLLGQACARAGLRDEAQQILTRLEERARTKFVTGWAIAVIRLALGDKDGAMNALQNAFDQHASEILPLKYDPLFDDLHGDPRFEALVQKVVGKEK